MQNVVVLSSSHFRSIKFPVDIIQNLKGYKFFILISESDLDNYKNFSTFGCIEKIIPVKFERDSLIKVCESIIEEYGQISNIVYLIEECVQLSGMLRKYYGISQDNLDRFRDKNLMMQKLENKEICVPKGMVFDDVKYQHDKKSYLLKIENYLSKYPLFIKPTNLMGSVDTYIIRNKNELIKWIEKKKDNTYLIQEYIDGRFFHCESFVQNNRILYSSVFEYSKSGFFF